MIYYRDFSHNKGMMFFLTFVLFALTSVEGKADEREASIPKNALYCEDCRSELSLKTSSFWKTDLDQALLQAKQEKKPIIAAFLGSNWCPWSQKLFEDILSQAGFLKGVQEDFLLVQVEITDPINAKSAALKQQYQIEQCPTLVLLNPNGEEMTRLGFLAFGPEEYGRHLKSLFGDYKEIETMLSRQNLERIDEKVLEDLYTKAKALDCKKYTDLILQEGLKRESESFFLLEKYASLLMQHKMRLKNAEVQEMRSKIIHSDPDNEQGGLLKLAIIDFQALAERAKKKDREKPFEAITPLMEYVKKFGKKDSENIWKVEMMIAQYLFSKNYSESALEHAKASYQAAPDIAKPEIASSIDYLQRYYDRNN